MEKPSKPNTKKERFESFLKEHREDGRIMVKMNGSTSIVKPEKYSQSHNMKAPDEYSILDISEWRPIPHNGWRD